MLTCMQVIFKFLNSSVFLYLVEGIYWVRMNASVAKVTLIHSTRIYKDLMQK